METQIISVYQPQHVANMPVVVTKRCAEWRASKTGQDKAAKTYRLIDLDGNQHGQERYRTMTDAIQASSVLEDQDGVTLVIDLA